MHNQSRIIQQIINRFFNPYGCWYISVWILKQKNFVNEPLAYYQVHDLKQFFKLINKILLFQYSERIFSASGISLALEVTRNAQLITLFLTPY